MFTDEFAFFLAVLQQGRQHSKINEIKIVFFIELIYGRKLLKSLRSYGKSLVVS